MGGSCLSRVPVIILSGYLGSGKTTLLVNLLEDSERNGLKFGIVMNEFGKMDVDSKIIGRRGPASIQSLNDGCVCCSKKSELIKSFEELLKIDPDVIFVELTGLANPEEIIFEMMKKELVSRVYVKSLVTVVDAQTLYGGTTTVECRNLFGKQLSSADMILVNKMDLVDSTAKVTINRMIRDRNDTAEILYSTYSKIDLNRILKRNRLTSTTINLGEQDEKGIQLSYDYMSTIAIPIPITVSKCLIEDYLFCLKPNLVRAKGFVRLEDNHIYLVQLIGNNVSWEVFQDYQEDPFITLIGIELNVNEAFNEFSRLTNKNVEELLSNSSPINKRIL
jgi:G3E family GTPase